MMICNKCGDKKPLSDFYPRNKVCKECTKKRVSAYQKGPGKHIHNKACREYNKSDKGKVALQIARENYNESQPLKQKAKWAVKRAIKQGKLIRPETCERCGCSCTPDAHHCDYSKPTDVMWLCKGCHVSWHLTNTPLYPENTNLQGHQ